uniref:Uncharacterized protein n=1 Tax=Candidatus Kentrum sp. UNK TaxID=2126344 RepID=A0A451B4E9_9GAMM|nr:MAG: hypothetical protein BECKUNK1418G_GA0071005_11862 [Candidatus Kentron sp. UNK]VFK73153.1 MAG: hypothetical protein BECKUNK1418H_GA0071006_11682 [Candidatus Kentron sp. UNK]
MTNDSGTMKNNAELEYLGGPLKDEKSPPNPAKPEPKIFVHYSPVIPLISGNPVTNISLIFLDRFVEDFLDYGLKRSKRYVTVTIIRHTDPRGMRLYGSFRAKRICSDLGSVGYPGIRSHGILLRRQKQISR